MSSFRNRIAEAYMDGEVQVAGACSCLDCGEEIADMVLAMPEMRAIRAYIWRETEPLTWMTIDEKERKHRHTLTAGFGSSVAEWVMGA